MRYQLLKETHDQLGHKGFYATQHTLCDCFWWPTINLNIQWVVFIYYQCQIMKLKHVVLPPTVQIPAPLFCKTYASVLWSQVYGAG